MSKQKKKNEGDRVTGTEAIAMQKAGKMGREEDKYVIENSWQTLLSFL